MPTLQQYQTFVGNEEVLATAITTSAGGADGNKIIATGSAGYIDLTLLPPGLETSAVSVLASENLAAGDFVNIYNNTGTANVRKADASNGRKANGYVLASVTSASQASVYLTGKNTSLTGLTPGTVYYLSGTTAGGFTTTLPTASNSIIQSLGTAISATALLFEFNDSIKIQ